MRRWIPWARRNRFVLLLFCALALNACNFLEPRRVMDPRARPTFAARHFQAPGGQDLPYRIYIPAGVSGARSLPLLLLLHSITERGDDNGANLAFFQPEFKEEFFREHPCIAVVPQCPAGKFWWDKPVTSALQGLVAHLMASLPQADPRRLYVSGASLGGYAVYGLLKEQPAWWAAAVPLCGDPSVVGLDLGLLKDQALWIFHGAKDPRVSVKGDRALVAGLKAVGSAVRYTEYADEGHRIWTRAYAQAGLWDWVFSQKKSRDPIF